MAHAHLAEMLDLDAEVLHDYHHEVTTWVTGQLPDRPRLIDVGAGSGTGTIALARARPDAEVVAVDVDEEMLSHLREQAAAAGVADRVRTVQADLDRPWPAIGPADLVWAAASMHHMASPAFALAQAHAVLRPGGLFAITELDSFPHFLTDPAGAALEDRCHDAVAKRRTEAGLHMDENWTARLIEAGFTVEAERRFDIALKPPLPAPVNRYAQVSLQRLLHGLADHLPAEDVASLQSLTTTLPTRTDLEVRTTRRVWLARR